MPFNGSGIYVPPSLPGSFNPAISGQQATPSDWNALLTDLSGALSLTITNDGQSVVVADIPFGGFKLTGVGSGTAATDAVNVSQLTANVTYAADTGAADAYVIAPAPVITGYIVGQTFQFKPTHTNATTTPTLAVNGFTAGIIVNADGTAVSAGALIVGTVVDVYVSSVTTGTPTFQLQTTTALTQASSDRSTKIATTAFVGSAIALRSYLAGLALSTAGSSATFGIAVGSAVNSTSVSLMTLSSAYTKTTSAWALGAAAGSLDTGAIANSTWYHVFLIQRPDTGVVDVLISLSPSSPTMPTNYTLFRRIGSMKTDGSAQWVLFSQNGSEFLWSVPTTDAPINTTVPVAAALVALNVPTGIKVNALVSGSMVGAASVLFTPPDVADTAPGAPGTAPCTAASTAIAYATIALNMRTNTSAQLRWRSDQNNVATIDASTLGWIDTRGRDA